MPRKERNTAGSAIGDKDKYHSNTYLCSFGKGLCLGGMHSHKTLCCVFKHTEILRVVQESSGGFLLNRSWLVVLCAVL